MPLSEHPPTMASTIPAAIMGTAQDWVTEPRHGSINTPFVRRTATNLSALLAIMPAVCVGVKVRGWILATGLYGVSPFSGLVPGDGVEAPPVLPPQAIPHTLRYTTF
jgi:hypothetical protein